MSDQQLTRATMIGPFPLPPVDDELRAEARGKQAGEWISFVDPAVDPAASPSAFAVQGGYQVGENGGIVDYRVNPEYYPSETRAGYRFTTGLELTIWRVKHGYGPLGQLADSFYHASLLAYAEHEGDTRVPTIADPEHPEVSLLPLASSADWTRWQHTIAISGSKVLELAGNSDVVLDLNPGTELALRFPARELAGLCNEATPYLLDYYAGLAQQRRSGET